MYSKVGNKAEEKKQGEVFLYEEKLKKSGSSYVIDMNLFFENYKDNTNLFVNNNEELEEMKSYQKTFFPSFAIV